MTIRKMYSLTSLLLLGSCLAGAQQGYDGAGALFDDNWKFALGDHAKAIGKDFDDKSWRAVDLPHDWSIEGAPDRRNPSGGAGGYFPTGIGWYRKIFAAPLLWKGKEIAILFEGVYMNAEVFVNGKSLGVHPYGYSSFSYDIGRLLEPGKENCIAVRVDNSQQINCRWYSGSGIYRHVRMLVRDPLHIDPWGVAITTPDADADRATVNVEALVKNDSRPPGDGVLSTVITGPDNVVVARDRVSFRLSGNGESHIARAMVVAGPLLWSVDSPRLYRATMTLTQNGKRRDAYTCTFGIRTLAFSAEHGFLLNGRAVKLYGGCIHHDNGCIGAVACDRAEVRKVELLKAAGFNAVRTSHNPPSVAFLDACDKLGLLVIDESFDGWRTAKNAYDYARFFDAWWSRDLESMVLRDRNHPSIIIWSVGNEILERKSPGAITTARDLVSLVHRYDTTRPVTSAMTTWDKEWEMYDPLFAAQDIGGYNYQLYRAASDHLRVPSRVIVQTESYPRDAFVNWNLIRHNSYIIGDFVWTAIDYLGESGIGRNIYPGEPNVEFWQTELFPWHGSDCGDIDLTGRRKPISHYRNILNNGTEALYMAVREPAPDTGSIRETLWSSSSARESWSWPGRDGKDMQVDVYSKDPRLRLYLNDTLVAEQNCTEGEEYKARFVLPYSRGTLKAVGLSGNGAADSTVLQTADRPVAIQLTADRKTLAADGQDLSYVNVELVDSRGVVNPNADNRLLFEVEGPAKLAGVGNADLKDTDNYSGSSRKAWHGRALVVIRSTRQAGTITLRVVSEGLKSGVVALQAVPAPAAR